jgi:predicted  nucleic acid-binding Zn-ribbon protein
MSAVDVSNRSSIDLSLELERQLESESLPATPAHSAAQSKDGVNRASLDPHVLAHIITQLRESLTHITRERDDLVYQLSESHSREAEFKDSVALWSERCANLEKDLEIARKKSQDDDEAISMLRSKGTETYLLSRTLTLVSQICSGGEPPWPYETSK